MNYSHFNLNRIRIYAFTLTLISIITFSCTKSENPEPVILSEEKEIKNFVFKAIDNPQLTHDYVGIFSSDSIKFHFPTGVLLEILKPTITFTGKSINPLDKAIQDFTNPVIYTVTAENDSRKQYIIYATLQKVDTTNFLSDSARLLIGRWSLLRDSAKIIGPWKFRTGGSPIHKDVNYYGSPQDFYKFTEYGIFSGSVNNITGSGPYKLLPDNKIDISDWTPNYGLANIATLSTDSLILFWNDSYNGGTMHRTVWLKK